MLEPDAAWVIRLLAGAALAGSEPCQYQGDLDVQSFTEQATALGHTVVVTRRGELGGIAEVVEPQFLAAASPRDAPDAPGEQPLLILTTGTTGLPKAVRHDWRRLSRPELRAKPTPEQRWLFAYGPHQYGGVQVLQHVVACQATLIAPCPRMPKDGLAAILNDRLTCVSATPTYWRFLLAEARGAEVTLPPLRQVTVGGEAVAPELLDDLRTAFPDARISQIYGATEFGTVASIRDGQTGVPAESLYSESNPTSHLRVIDGQLWVRPTVETDGYVGQPSPAADAGDWLPTGDMVEIVGDRVEFRGRSSDVINVGGVKVHPIPIEAKIGAVERVAVVRVIGRPNRLTGAIVAAEVVPAPGVEETEHDAIRDEIRAAVADLPPAWHPRSIRFVEQIETHGQKLSRRVRS
jgi:acyl-coenzyme A synthetase/AMP-(fatty) acid ligase